MSREFNDHMKAMAEVIAFYTSKDLYTVKDLRKGEYGNPDYDHIDYMVQTRKNEPKEDYCRWMTIAECWYVHNFVEDHFRLSNYTVEEARMTARSARQHYMEEIGFEFDFTPRKG